MAASLYEISELARESFRANPDQSLTSPPFLRQRLPTFNVQHSLRLPGGIDPMLPLLATSLRSFALLPAELNLATVLKSGQSFRWHKFENVVATQPDEQRAGIKEEEKPVLLGEEYAMAWKDRTIVLRQDGTRCPLSPSTLVISRS